MNAGPTLRRAWGVIAAVVAATALVTWATRERDHGQVERPKTRAARRADERPKNHRAPALRARKLQRRVTRAQHHEVVGRVQSKVGGRPLQGTVCLQFASVQDFSLDNCLQTEPDGSFNASVGMRPQALVAMAEGHRSTRHDLAETDAASAAPVVIELEEHPTVALEGRVQDAYGGAVAGAVVRGWSEAGEQPSFASSDAEGRFRLGADAGRWRVEARARGYATTHTAVEVPDRDVRLVLSPASSIGGCVVDADTGDAIAGAEVQAFGGLEGPAEHAQASVGADGCFLFSELPAGLYSLTASASGWQSLRLSVGVPVAARVEDVELRLAPAAAIVGTVLVAGEPCEEARVILEGPIMAFAEADAAGVVHLGELAPGDYAVAVHCPTGAPLRDGVRLARGERAQLEWWLEPGLRLRGLVLRASGRPRAGLTVHARSLSLEAPPPEAASAVAEVERRCETDRAGEFLCTGLSPGVYEVGVASLEGDWSPEAQRIELRPGEEPVLRLLAPPSASVTVGPVELAPGESRPELLARSPGHDEAHVATFEPPYFRFEDLPLGSYEILVGGRPEPYATVALTRDEERAQLAWVHESARVTLRGQVVDEQGNPVPDAWVRALAETPAGLLSAGAPMLTSGAGEFSLEVLEDGTYTLEVGNAWAQTRKPGVSAGQEQVVALLPRAQDDD